MGAALSTIQSLVSRARAGETAALGELANKLGISQVDAKTLAASSDPGALIQNAAVRRFLDAQGEKVDSLMQGGIPAGGTVKTQRLDIIGPSVVRRTRDGRVTGLVVTVSGLPPRGLNTIADAKNYADDTLPKTVEPESKEKNDLFPYTNEYTRRMMLDCLANGPKHIAEKLQLFNPPIELPVTLDRVYLAAVKEGVDRVAKMKINFDPEDGGPTTNKVMQLLLTEIMNAAVPLVDKLNIPTDREFDDTKIKRHILASFVVGTSKAFHANYTERSTAYELLKKHNAEKMVPADYLG
jgi:hypothetical protein